MRSWKAGLLVIGAALTTCGCTEDADLTSTSNVWPDAECRRLGLDFQVDPQASMDAALSIFRDRVLPHARDSGRRFPGYHAWLMDVRDAVRRHELIDGGDASDGAQAELQTFIPPIPPEMRDTMTRAALREQTQFREMARNITKRMRCQSDERRGVASEHLRSTYDLPH